MGFEPEKFFIGILDFFSILLPGALFTYLVKDRLGPELLGSGYYALEGAEGGAIFLFSAYLTGHFIFLIGALLLDDLLYDPIRTATHGGTIGRLAKCERRPWPWTRFLARCLISKDADAAVRQVVRIKENYLDPIHGSSTVNAFQWAKARLTLEHPDAMSHVKRFEADSKFFRSFVIVLVPVIAWVIVSDWWPDPRSRALMAGASMTLLLLAFYRYVEQRVKATNQAYWYIITAEGQKVPVTARAPRSSLSRPSRAGGVVYREENGNVSYLLVQTSKDASKWVLPKGHIKPGERADETAVREVWEEADVWARVRAPLEAYGFVEDCEAVHVQPYLMEWLAPKTKREMKKEKDNRSKPKRKHAWVKHVDAIKLVPKESVPALELAEATRLQIIELDRATLTSTSNETTVELPTVP